MKVFFIRFYWWFDSKFYFLQYLLSGDTPGPRVLFVLYRQSFDCIWYINNHKYYFSVFLSNTT